MLVSGALWCLPWGPPELFDELWSPLRLSIWRTDARPKPEAAKWVLREEQIPAV